MVFPDACVCVYRDQLGVTQSELAVTKELYVSVCKVKDELKDKMHDLQAENTRAKVQISHNE